MQLFAHVDSDKLTKILSRSVVNRYPTRTLLFKQNEKVMGIWVVMRGKVKVFKTVNISRPASLEENKRSSSLGVKSRFQDKKDIDAEEKQSEPGKLPSVSSKGRSSSVLRPSRTSSSSSSKNSITEVSAEDRSKSSKQTVSRPNFRVNSRSSSVTKTRSNTENDDKSQGKEASMSRLSKPEVPKFRQNFFEAPTNVSIDDYEEGTIMGVTCYLRGLNFQISAVVEEPADILVISHDVIELEFDLLSKEILKNYSREYPSDAEVRNMYLQTLKWAQFKKTLFDEKLFQTKRMIRLQSNSREVLMKKPELPKDIVRFICNKPKPLFFSKKKKAPPPPEVILSSKATSTKHKEVALRQDYETSGTQSAFENLENRRVPSALKTVDLNNRSHSTSKHLSLD